MAMSIQTPTTFQANDLNQQRPKKCDDLGSGEKESNVAEPQKFVDKSVNAYFTIATFCRQIGSIISSNPRESIVA